MFTLFDLIEILRRCATHFAPPLFFFLPAGELSERLLDFLALADALFFFFVALLFFATLPLPFVERALSFKPNS